MRQQPSSDERSGAGGTVRPAPGRPASPSSFGPTRGFRDPRISPPGRHKRRSILAGTIENTVIPSLLGAHGAHTALGRAALSPALPPSLGQAIEVLATGRGIAPTQHHVDRLVELVLTEDQPAAASFVASLHTAGTDPDSLYLDLLTPTARRLGVMWEEDECDFTDVTIGLIRLQHVMRELLPAFARNTSTTDAKISLSAPRALLVQMPGEQHGMGLAMVTAFFRRAGWQVATAPVADSAELLSLVRRYSYDVVGISVSCSDRIERLATDIRAIRHQSCNAATSIMVGGPPFIDHPQLAEMVGADATAIDGRQAVQQAHLLIATRNAAR